MNSKEFCVVNSFGEKTFEGNPAAILLDGSNLSDEVMQSMAKQLNLVETVFVLGQQSNKYDFELRYFTPLQEVPIAGHPTVATFIALEHYGLINIEDKDKYVIKTKAGLQWVEAKRDKNGMFVMMKALDPIFYSIVEERALVAETLGIGLEDLMEDLPIQPVDTGLGHLIVPVKSLEVLMKVERKINELKELCQRYKMREAQVFTFETYREGFHLHTRNICPREGIEDPGCGLGNAALGAYLFNHKYSRVNEVNFNVEQGNIVNMPCAIKISVRRQDDQPKVMVGGGGFISSRGEIFF